MSIFTANARYLGTGMTAERTNAPDGATGGKASLKAGVELDEIVQRILDNSTRVESEVSNAFKELNEGPRQRNERFRP